MATDTNVRTFVLTVPGCPPSMNHGGSSRRHWSAAYKEKRLWQGTFEGALLEARVPRGMVYCCVDVWVRWRFYNHRSPRETENFRGPICKPLFDALKNGRWIPDDKDEYIRLASLQFEYPENWEWPQDPRVKAELVIRLEATYA